MGPSLQNPYDSGRFPVYVDGIGFWIEIEFHDFRHNENVDRPSPRTVHQRLVHVRLCRLCRHLYPPGLDEAVCPQIGGEEDPTTPTIRPSNCVVTRSVSEPSRDGTHSRARGRQAHYKARSRLVGSQEGVSVVSCVGASGAC